MFSVMHTCMLPVASNQKQKIQQNQHYVFSRAAYHTELHRVKVEFSNDSLDLHQELGEQTTENSVYIHHITSTAHCSYVLVAGMVITGR